MTDKLASLKQKLKVKIRLAQVKAARELAQAIPDAIRIRTQQEGKDAKGRDLKELTSEAYIRKRELADNLSPDTSPKTSNLTATGQLIDSIKGKNIGTRVVIEPGKAKRKGELGGGKSKLTNKQVNKYVEENGREFLALSKEEKEEVFELARQIILAELKGVTN